jgi:hypothetical protein
MTSSTVTLRLASADDEREIRRLAALDTSPTPAAPALLATENGTLVAALSLVDGVAVANPFVPSQGALDLLRIRAAHIRRERLPSRRRLRRWLGAVRSSSNARASLAGSPPGAGGRLLDLSTEHRAITHPR